MNVMFLAAGLGTRLMPYTEKTPKPAIPFLGAPMAAFSVALLEKIKIHNLVVNTHHLPEQIETLFRSLPLGTKNLFFTSEKEALLDSGGGIHNAKKYLIGDNDFLTMNADELILPHQMGSVEDMIAFHQWHKGLATLMVMKHPEVGKKFGGAWTGEDTQVKLFSKVKPAENLHGWHFVGVMIFSQRIFNYFKPQLQPENILYDTLTHAMSAGEEVHVFETQCEWLELGSISDFVHAAHYCIDACQTHTDEYWKQHLLQVLRLYGHQPALIEKSDPALIKKMAEFFAKNNI